jgi:isochorismate synthase
MAEISKENIQKAVQTCIKQKASFVFYRLPDSNEIHFMGETIPGITPESAAQGFMFNPFLRSDKVPAVFIRKDNHYAGKPEDFKAVKFNIEDVCGEDQVNHKSDKQEFCTQVDLAVKAIRKGKLEKVVMSRVEKATVVEKNPFTLFSALCKKHASAFVSLVVIPGKTVWLTATPELLISLEGDTIRSASLAGTKPVSNEIPWGEKEKVEQQMVTDYIYNILAHNCIDLETTPTEEVIAGNVAHLKTQFKGTLNTGMYQILNDLHPTPAVCGLPKDKALEFIKDMELHQRKYYSGYLGPCNMNGKTEWYVNLRCAELFVGRANIFIGCGVTADSIPEKEWNETIMKAQTLLSVIAPTLRVV